MIDTWFKEDLARILEQHPVAIFIDESGEAEFLLKSLKRDCDVYRTNGELEELEAKYRVERPYKSILNLSTSTLSIRNSAKKT